MFDNQALIRFKQDIINRITTHLLHVAYIAMIKNTT